MPLQRAEGKDAQHSGALIRRAVQVAATLLLVLAGVTVATLAVVSEEGPQASHTSAQWHEGGGRALTATPADPAPPSVGQSAAMWSMIVVPCMLVLSLWALRRFQPRVSLWTGLLICSYFLLIPGLVCKIFDYRISGMSGKMEIRRRSDTMGGFAVALASEGGMGWFGASMVVLYAMVIPAIKLVLFLAAEFWRHGTPQQIRWARTFVIVLKVISKWASPDIFAYVLLIHLVRGLTLQIDVFGMPMEALTGTGFLRPGFTGFATFCVFSTIATLGLRTPDEPKDSRQVAVVDSKARLNGNNVIALTCVLFAAFAVLLCVGVQMPCMALRMNMNVLYEPNGPVPLRMKDMVEKFDIASKAQADVSMWACVTQLFWHATHGGGPNELVALVLYSVFVIAFTVLDMFALVIAAFQQHSKIFGEPQDSKQHLSAMAVSHVLKKLSMMDVALVGIALVVSCGSVYKKNGTALYFRWGLVVLLGAEACHYLAYFLVTRTAPQEIAEVVGKQADKVEQENGKCEEDEDSMSGNVV